MRRRLVFATNNIHKLEEVSAIVGDRFSILSLRDIHALGDIPETADTLEGNALQKARYVKERYGVDCFADDTGLEVEALDNAPGVYTARYAGSEQDSQANMRKLLQEMEGEENRKARFRTVIALILGKEEYLFEGIINGSITQEKRGKAGFGYDPVFLPEGYTQTFAELGEPIKNTISHRALATHKLADFLATVSD